MPMLPYLLIGIGALLVVALVLVAVSGPSVSRIGAKRLAAMRARYNAQATMAAAMEAQIRNISAQRGSRADAAAWRYLPNPALLDKRLSMTGKPWTVGQYGIATLVLTGVTAGILLLLRAPVWLAIFAGLAVGVGIPHMVVGFFIKRRTTQFTTKFPDAIELLVRGLRSGLPITETIGVVGNEIEGPVGEEFRAVADKMRIGRPLDSALQEAADRIGTPEFQFFIITIAIQRETGGNLAETLANLADVLRKRGQMKLKIKALSSESKASAYIVGSLPFFVFGMIWAVNNNYIGKFFLDERLMVAGIGGLIWMGIGVLIMAKMVSFEI